MLKQILCYVLIIVMYCVELTDDYKTKLDDVTTNFEDNVRRGFNNVGVRLQDRKKEKKITLEDVAYSHDDAFINLKNIKLLRYPDFRIKRFNVDLSNASIDVEFSLGTLEIECDAQSISGRTMFRDMSIVQNVKLIFHLNGTEARGRVGLFTIEDSFVPKNYLINYFIDNVEVKAIDGADISTYSFIEGEFSPLALFLIELKQKLTRAFHSQLADVIVEYSVNELLLNEEEEIIVFRQYLRIRQLKANEIIDNLLNESKNRMISTNVATIMQSDFLLSYKHEHSTIRSTMTAKGVIRNIESITRPTDWSLYESNKEFVIYGYLSLKDFKFLYDYETYYIHSQITGTISATVFKNTFQVLLSIKKGDRCRVDDVFIHISDLDDIEIDVTGLGALNWLLPNIRSVVLGHIRHDIECKVVTVYKQYLLQVSEDNYCVA